MAEETRRSGRANKGQHTKNQDALDEPVAAPAPAPKSKGQAKSDKKGQGKGRGGRAPSAQSAPSPEQEEEEEEEDAIIRCVCGDQRDIRGREMICCDKCEAWQHNKCLDLPEGEYWEGKSYYCEQCKPEDHKELLEAMARGEKPWARKKGSKPKARPSDVVPNAAAEATSAPPAQAPPAAAQPKEPTPAQEEANGHAEAKDTKSQPQSPMGEKRRHESTSEKANAGKRRKKSTHVESKPAAPAAPTNDIDSLPQLQKLLAESLRDTLAPLISQASDTRGYRIPDGDTAKSLAARLALNISNAALSHLGEPTGREGPYPAKLRAIMFNVKKNAVLVDQLLSGSLKAPEIVAMEAEDMASEDKQREYAAMREAAEKQMILTDEGGPRLRKTHKGEELVGEDDTVHEFKQPNLREREDVPEDAAMHSPVTNRPGESPVDGARRPLSVDTAGAPADGARRPSTNFDINSVFDKVRSPQHDQPAFIQRRQSSLHQLDKPQAPIDDADVDRLLKDEDNDVEMTGYSSDPTICWHGSISMQSVEPFDAVARFVAGGDFGQVVPWEKLLTDSLSIQGRIESAKGDEYIRGIAGGEQHDVAVLALSPVSTDGRTVIDHFYQYFHSRGRWGVVPVNNLGNDIMRDLYLIPIEAGGSNLPGFMDMLQYCTIETPRKENMMVLALVAKLPSIQPQLPATQHFDRYPAQDPKIGQGAQPVAPMTHTPSNGPPSQSPVPNPQAPQFSPVGPGFPPPYGGPFPPHPNDGQQAPPLPMPGAPQMPPNAHHQVPRAVEILGPFIDAPVIVHILRDNMMKNQHVPEEMLGNLRHIVETVPQAQSDFNVLLDHMSKRNSAQKSQANGQPPAQHR